MSNYVLFAKKKNTFVLNSNQCELKIKDNHFGEILFN